MSQSAAPDLRVLRRLLLLLLLLLVAGYVAAHVWTAGHVARGTTVDDVPVGGMTLADADRRLRDHLADRADAPLRVGAGGAVTTIDPTRAGLSFDVPATLAQLRPGRGAGRRSGLGNEIRSWTAGWRPGDLWDWVADRPTLTPVVRVDDDALADAVAGFARRVDDPAVQGGVRFAHGEVTATYPEVGQLLARSRAATVIRDAFVSGPGWPGLTGTVVALPTVTDRSAVSSREVSRAMDDFANPAVSGPVTVLLGHHALRLRPEDFTAALSVHAEGGRLRPQVDEQTLLQLVRPRMEAVRREPRDARVVTVHGRPRIVPARAGRWFDPAVVGDGFLAALTSQDRTIRVPVTPLRPAVSTAQLEALEGSVHPDGHGGAAPAVVGVPAGDEVAQVPR